MHKAHVYLALILQFLGLFFFAKGFFPVKIANLTGFAKQDVDDVKPLFDSLVFVVIDALRSDFAYGPKSQMKALQEFIHEGVAIPFTARAATPTVTLPRLKCLTTGAITGFLDAILNIAESDDSSDVTSQDSWVQQSLHAGRRLHMYGDDTWQRLFPTAFAESDGTSSFFVKDFTEVDLNVTRHLDQQLRLPEWDMLILHYLGLDHIGHLEGPESVHMPAKQKEMDDVLVKIYEQSRITDKILDRRTLMVVLGDHGMTGDGNHGGASDAETQTALTFVSPLLSQRAFNTASARSHMAGATSAGFDYYDTILQSDLVPALSLLLGLPIPKNSLGIVPHKILDLWDDPMQSLAALQQNARQLQGLLIAGNSPPIKVHAPLSCTMNKMADHCALTSIDFNLSVTNMSVATEQAARSEIYMLMQFMQDNLRSVSNNYGMLSIYLGWTCLVLSLLIISVQFLQIAHSRAHLIAIVVPVLHSATAFASSFIEEEQVFWYYTATVLLAWIIAYRVSSLSNMAYLPSTACALLAFRILRRYNQTGQKFSGAPDISTLLRQYPTWKYCSLLLAQAGTCYKTFSCSCILSISLVTTVTFVMLFIIKLPGDNSLSTGTTLSAVRITWLCTMLMIYHTSRKDIRLKTPGYVFAASLLFMLQTRQQNAVVLVFFHLIDHGLRQQTNIVSALVTYFVMQQASFFILGNSNSLSGLDLSQAYNGISTYNEFLVGVLLFISTFIGPLYWQTAMCNWIRDHPKAAEARRFSRTYVVLCSCMYATALCASCFALRHHLFVFSVFSPKLLFSVAWSIFYGFCTMSF